MYFIYLFLFIYLFIIIIIFLFWAGGENLRTKLPLSNCDRRQRFQVKSRKSKFPPTPG